jgi:flagellar biosynthesis anti-sigma factor FlgM
MVGTIKNFSGPRLEVAKGKPNNGTGSVAEKVTNQVENSSSGSNVDAILTNKSKEAIKIMAENPSVNMESVQRIKDKIKNGEYPIDFDKLADKLLESYWVSKS